ncbi:MAG: tricarballylate utilization 4Fe-4S protein TcuB [Dehalococcoidia bacterium]|nr:tricarballylate utilization 4Fe-4S protein TcuB [Dehalococcoidia bacterium]
MPLDDTLKEADRQLTVCNACRYCEGYCAVFPAMERRRTFATEDLIYMANLCFECRACYNACQFAPPHEFGINIPQALSAVRVETYAEYTGPRLLSKLYRGNGKLVAATVAIVVALVFGSVLMIQGSEVLFEADTAEGAFFRVVPYMAMTVPALVLSAVWMAAFAVGGVRFWRNTGGTLSELMDVKSFLRASKDAFGLKYLEGAGEGCTYPTSHFSQARRWFHHALVWGVLLDLASTTLAAVYHNFLGRESPYPYFSLPVVLGTAGGVLIIVGIAGLFELKRRSDKAPSYAEMLNQDLIFLWLLLITSASGLILLALRETSIMGTLLTLHLGIVAALYLTLPYGKFAHVIYRYAALIRYQIENRREEQQRSGA